jgi:hypothetical protein
VRAEPDEGIGRLMSRAAMIMPVAWYTSTRSNDSSCSQLPWPAAARCQSVSEVIRSSRGRAASLAACTPPVIAVSSSGPLLRRYRSSAPIGVLAMATGSAKTAWMPWPRMASVSPGQRCSEGSSRWGARIGRHCVIASRHGPWP